MDGNQGTQASEGPLDFSVKEYKKFKPVEADICLDLSVSGSRETKKMRTEMAPAVGGWLQVNNTLVPYVLGEASQKLLPLSVLRKAANLMCDTQPFRKATPEESSFLNMLCQQAAVHFVFVKHTKLVTLDSLVAHHKELFVEELPASDPFQHAEVQPIGPQTGGGPGNNIGPSLSSVLPPGFSFPLMQPVPMPIEIAPGGPFHHRFPPALSRPIGPMMMTSTAQPMFPVRDDNLRMARRRSEPASVTSRSANGLPKTKPSEEPKGSMPKVQKTQQNSPRTTGNSKVAKQGFQIRPFQLNGRPISCLVEGGLRFALLEAVARVFFPESNMKVVHAVLETVLNIPMRILTAEQERAFIAFYCLPTKTLRCRLVVDIDLIDSKMSDIRAVLQDPVFGERLGKDDEERMLGLNTNQSNPVQKKPTSGFRKANANLAHFRITERTDGAPTVLKNKQLNEDQSNGKKMTKPKKRSLEDTISHLLNSK